MRRTIFTSLAFVGLLLSVGLWGISYMRVLLHVNCQWSVVVSAGGLICLYNKTTVVGSGIEFSVNDHESLKIFEHVARKEGWTVLAWQERHLGLTWSGFEGMATLLLPHFSDNTFVTGDRRHANYTVIIPFWIPVVLFSFCLWHWYTPIYRCRRRRKLGLCLKCGYDLRGQTESRCPECGEEFDTTAMD